MTLTIEAIYENGVLKPTQPLPLKESEKVQITVHSPIISLADSYGMMGGKGTHEELDRLLAEADEAEDLA